MDSYHKTQFTISAFYSHVGSSKKLLTIHLYFKFTFSYVWLLIMGKTIFKKPTSNKKNKARVKRESARRRAQRYPLRVAKKIIRIIVALISLGAIPKLPMIAASDVLNLAYFTAKLTRAAYPVQCLTVCFIVAHHLRTPKLVKRLCDKLMEIKPNRASELVSCIVRILSQSPFDKQKNGLPFFIGMSKFHTGVPQILQWCTPEYEVRLL